MKRTRIEAEQTWEIINQFLPSFAVRVRRPAVQNPRPVADKLIISAGKAIARAVKNGNDLEQKKTAAVKAASVIAKKYGLASVPQEIIANIEGGAKRHFNAVSA